MKDLTRGLLTGFGAGALTMAILPFAIPVVAEVMRPLAKAILKQSMLGEDRLRTHAARLSEAVQDLVAEVRVEVAEELAVRAKAESSVVSSAAAEAARIRAKKTVS